MQKKCRALAWSAAALIAALPAAARAQPKTIMGRLIQVAVGYGPFGNPWEDTQPGAELRYAARIVGLIIGSLLAFLGVVFLILMIGAGVRWMLARGNEADIEKAKATIKSAAVGLLIVVLSYSFVTLVSALVVETGLLGG